MDRLIRKAERNNARFMIRFDPTKDQDSIWSIKYFPHPDDDGHFYALSSSLSAAITQILDEIEGFA